MHEGSKRHGANSKSGSTSNYKIFDALVDSIRPPEGVALGPESAPKKAQNSKIDFEISKQKWFSRSDGPILWPFERKFQGFRHISCRFCSNVKKRRNTSTSVRLHHFSPFFNVRAKTVRDTSKSSKFASEESQN